MSASARTLHRQRFVIFTEACAGIAIVSVVPQPDEAACPAVCSADNLPVTFQADLHPPTCWRFRHS